MLTNIETKRLEQRIAHILEVGFMRTPQPDGKAFDRADAATAAHDISDMLLNEYLLEDKEGLAAEIEASEPSISELADRLKKIIAEPMGPSPVNDIIRASGLGGGMGDLE